MVHGSYIPSVVRLRIEKYTLFIILLLITLALLLNSCKSGPPSSQPPEAITPSPGPTQTVPATEPPASLPPQEVTPKPEPTTTIPETETPPEVKTSPGQLSFSATPEKEELKDVNWISPGKVNIENLYPGATAEYPITVHNGSDDPAEFAITARQPDQITEDYEPLPVEYLSWVTIAQPELSLKPKQTVDVLITITMPENASYAGKRAEFWISVIDKSQEGMVRTELAARWLIATK